MNLARILLIVAALAVAGVTAYLVKSYLQDKEAQIAESGQNQTSEKSPTVQVLVALSNLPTGTIVNPDLFRWQNWPEDGLSPEYIVQGAVKGKADGAESTSAMKPADLTGWAVRRGITAKPFCKSALQLTPALPRRTARVRQIVAVRCLIGKVWHGLRVEV